MIAFTSFQTPLGKMIAGATDAGVCLFDFEYRKSIEAIKKRVEVHVGSSLTTGEHPYFDWLKLEIDEYFKGGRQEFTVPVHLTGTPFQVRVWEALQQIPYGETRTYQQQSVALGNEKAIRAVAGANGENGIAIIIPCHRVVGKNGSLVGYGGGLPRKQWLLNHELKYSGKNMQMKMF